MSTPLHSRRDWGARAPLSRSTSIDPEGITAHWAGPSPWGNVDRSSPEAFRASTSHDRCASIVRGWQAFHMDGRGWVDLAYSSCVCPHGHRYDGRGPGYRTAANGTNAGNSRSYAVVYIGGEGDPLTSEAKAAFSDEEERLRRLRWDHSDWKSTSCAGPRIRAWEAQGWPDPGVVSVPGGRPSLPPAPVTGSHRLLRRGVRGDDVRQWQTVLAGAGHGLAVDGIFGPVTESATKAFQRTLRVADDGIVGPETRRATAQLFRWLAAASGRRAVPSPPSYPGMVSLGDRGESVRIWQETLNRAGYDLTVDGIFGPATNHVVRHFQRREGLIVDGIAGPATWRAL